MVLEHADERSFFEWLLGTGWEQGAFFRCFPLIVGIAVAVMLIGLLIVLLRSRPLTRSKRRDWALFTGVSLLIAVPIVLLFAGYPPEIQILAFTPESPAANGWYSMDFDGETSADLEFNEADPASMAPGIANAFAEMGYQGTRVVYQSGYDFKVIFGGVSAGIDFGKIRIMPPTENQLRGDPGGAYRGEATSRTVHSGVGKEWDGRGKDWGLGQRLFGGTWYYGALFFWLLIVAGLIVLGFMVRWLFLAVRYGPIQGLKRVCKEAVDGVGDLAHISSRRVLALSWLAVRESLRRRVVVVFGVFVVILLFAGWFLDPSSTRPAQLYLSFVLTATTYLVLLLALFLSALSLPEDIKQKTIYTVVTKPVRSCEIVLGRICGFAAVGTILLVIMGTISYVFVVRGLSHTHELTDALVGEGRTGKARHHWHPVTADDEGQVRVSVEQGHWHDVTGRPGETYALGAPQGMLVARVPIYGQLRFKNRQGKDVAKGVNVGDEWGYRSFIEGGTLATAIWTFEGVTEDTFPEEQFPQGIPVEMTIEVFRTYAGDRDDPDDIPGIPGSLSVRNPETGEPAEVTIFTAKDFVTDVQYIPRTLRVPNVDEVEESCEKIFHELDKDGSGDLTEEEFVAERKVGKDEIAQGLSMVEIDKDGDGKLSLDEFTDASTKVDLFKDMIVDGKMVLWLRCLHPSQFYGAAEPDVYLRARDDSFTANFIKGYVGIWLQMVIIIGVGVMFSTFLSGPVATIATAGALVGGVFSRKMASLGANQFMSEDAVERMELENIPGGGTFESLIRLLTQQNVVSDMEDNLRSNVAQMIDVVMGYTLFVTSYILPQFYRFDFSNFVAKGFNIPGDDMCICLCRTLAYMVPVFAAAFLFLKSREVAQ